MNPESAPALSGKEKKGKKMEQSSMFLRSTFNPFGGGKGKERGGGVAAANTIDPVAANRAIPPLYKTRRERRGEGEGAGPLFPDRRSAEFFGRDQEGRRSWAYAVCCNLIFYDVGTEKGTIGRNVRQWYVASRGH